MSKRSVAAALAAVAVLGGGATTALAGEVIGPPGSVEEPGTPKDTSHANSICSFSGLNDFVEGPTDSITQSWGQDVKTSVLAGEGPLGGVPGVACRGGSNPDRPS